VTPHREKEDDVPKTLPASKDKALFTPGPLTTSAAVKQAMLRDIGSRDPEFLAVVREIREELVDLGEVAGRGYDAVLVQGSGTFALEAVVGSAVPRDGKLLVVVNGAYGRRLVQIAAALRIPVTALGCAEDQLPDLDAVERALAEDPAFTHVAAVHSETSSGILNPVEALGEVVARHGRSFVVDAMSSFGAVPLDLASARIDFLVSSANKCIEGVPGFAFVLARREALRRCEGRARSLALDLYGQWRGLEADGQFRFTPPTHALLAFRQALRELREEGGIRARGARYRANQQRLAHGMARLGFVPYLPRAVQGPIITAFRYPDPAFDFPRFYRALSDRGYVVYAGKLTQADCFRLGNIGRLFPSDVEGLLAAVRDVSVELGLALPGARGAPARPLRPVADRVRAVILDWAGTVVDFGCCAPALAFVEVFGRNGVSLSVDEARGPMGTAKRRHLELLLADPAVGARWAERLGRAAEPHDVDRLYAEFVPIQTDLLARHARLIPGTLDLVAELQRRQIAVGTTTGYSSAMMAIVAAEAARQGFSPDVTVTPDGLPGGRPAPWMALEAARRMEVHPLAAIVKVGDTVADVEEGRNAGMWTVAVAATGNEVGLPEDELAALPAEERRGRIAAARERLSAAGSHFVVDGIHEVPAVLDELDRRLARGETP
jgi:2-aminoethylphosphonate-pyruvate transaminase